MDLAKKIGIRLKDKRRSLGFTQSQMAEFLGLSLTYYGEVERGNKLLSLETFATTCEKLNLDPSQVLTGVKSMDVIVSTYLADCPRDKRFDLEQLLKYASNLYR